jgi:hypothetical protein
VPVRITLKATKEPLTRPKRDDFESAEAYAEAFDRFRQAADVSPRYGAFCENDGSFHVPNVPAGTYSLEMKIGASQLNPVIKRESEDTTSWIATLNREITVPDSAGGGGNESLDLGSLELEVMLAPAAPNR